MQSSGLGAMGTALEAAHEGGNERESLVRKMEENWLKVTNE